MEIPEAIGRAWPHLTTASAVGLSVAASAHAILYKRDVRAAVGWVGLAWLVPFLGAILYWLLGINRISRRAKSLRMVRGGFTSASVVPAASASEVAARCQGAEHLDAIRRLVDGVVTRPLLPGNQVTLLDGGDQAYPSMLDAVERAERSVSLCTYIFDNDRVGRRFVEALGEATRRGVEVRVLIDSVGSRYSTPPIQWRLRRAGVRHALFLRTWAPGRWSFMNLRNHRKILVVDGTVGFAGGMNIRDDFWSEDGGESAHDLHFRLEGPVVGHLQETFAEDWVFTTREVLRGDLWFPTLEPRGDLLCRGIPDGPDEDFESLRYVLLGALSVAQRSVRIVTPYFLPDPALITALRVAALRGVRVEVLLPARSNIPLVQWATMAQMNQIMEAGCHVFLTPPPFDHSKLMVVDGCWSLVGSANWDPRSLRLNFELDVEAFGAGLADTLETWIDRRKRTATPFTLDQWNTRSLPVRLRDGIARLFSPYL
ncbi:MAG: phospholipase D-like domain-containing protein [Myxococcota bacterium]